MNHRPPPERPEQRARRRRRVARTPTTDSTPTCARGEDHDRPTDSGDLTPGAAEIIAAVTRLEADAARRLRLLALIADRTVIGPAGDGLAHLPADLLAELREEVYGSIRPSQRSLGNWRGPSEASTTQQGLRSPTRTPKGSSRPILSPAQAREP